MIDYSIYYKRQLDLGKSWGSEGEWDVFLSAYVPSDRIIEVFAKADAPCKVWLLLPEYEYLPIEHPKGQVFTFAHFDEATYVAALWDQVLCHTHGARLCIDITGFIRPYLMYLLRFLYAKGVRKFDALYAEPLQYEKRELTQFSNDVVREVRQVAGFEGTHGPDVSKDLLIIGSGYEDNLVAHVAEDKAKATKLQLVGFPSLRPDMYHESVIRLQRAEESLGGRIKEDTHNFFAPANDPFVAATELSRIAEKWRAKPGITNLYLSPLSTKAHVLGFTLFYLMECLNSATSVIYPFEQKCSRSSSRGLVRVWKYTVEL